MPANAFCAGSFVVPFDGDAASSNEYFQNRYTAVNKDLLSFRFWKIFVPQCDCSEWQKKTPTQHTIFNKNSKIIRKFFTDWIWVLSRRKFAMKYIEICRSIISVAFRSPSTTSPSLPIRRPNPHWLIFISKWQNGLINKIKIHISKEPNTFFPLADNDFMLLLINIGNYAKISIGACNWGFSQSSENHLSEQNLIWNFRKQLETIVWSTTCSSTDNRFFFPSTQIISAVAL